MLLCLIGALLDLHKYVLNTNESCKVASRRLELVPFPLKPAIPSTLFSNQFVDYCSSLATLDNGKISLVRAENNEMKLIARSQFHASQKITAIHGEIISEDEFKKSRSPHDFRYNEKSVGLFVSVKHMFGLFNDKCEPESGDADLDLYLRHCGLGGLARQSFKCPQDPRGMGNAQIVVKDVYGTFIMVLCVKQSRTIQAGHEILVDWNAQNLCAAKVRTCTRIRLHDGQCITPGFNGNRLSHVVGKRRT